MMNIIRMLNWASAYGNTFASDWAGSFVSNQREILPLGPQTLSSNPGLRQRCLRQGEYIGDASKVPELEKEYPAPDRWKNLPSSGFFIRHVKQISLNDVTLDSLATDPRRPVIADDVENLQISDLRSDHPDTTAVQLLNVRTFKQK